MGELEANKLEIPKIEAAYQAAQQKEKEEKMRFQDEKMEQRDRHAKAVHTLEEQTLEIRNRTKDTKTEIRKLHDLIQYEKQQCEEQEKWLKDSRSAVHQDMLELNKHTDHVKFKTKEAARAYQEDYWATTNTQQSVLTHMNEAK